MVMRPWIGKLLVTSAVALIFLPTGSVQVDLSAQTNDPAWLTAAASALDGAVQKVRQGLIVYEDVDSGYNHGTFSGFFGTAVPKLSIDPGCVPNGNPPTGCSTDPNVLDKDHGTVIRFTFQPLTSNEFVGVSCVEPQGFFVGQAGSSYDLRGVNQISFDAMSPDTSTGIKVQFGFGGSTTPAFQTLLAQWTHYTITLAQQSSFTDLQHTNILFTIVTNAANAPNGGTVLVDNIRFDPTPTVQAQALGFPAAYKTYGAVPVTNDLSGPVPIPPDQLFRNQAPLDQMAWTASVLTAIGGIYTGSARTLLDTFVYEAANPNIALAPPADAGQPQTRGLLSCFSSGDAALKNDSGGALAGSGRPCGFSVGTQYRVVLDGTVGGQAATVILALLRGYMAFGDVRYLNTALSLGNWIQQKLADPSTADYGGYYYGYLYVPQVNAKIYIKSKRTVDNALIFSAFTALGDVEASLGKSDAAAWRSGAAAAGQFVKSMYRPDGRFYSGTVPESQPTDLTQGIRADGPLRGGERINSYDVIGNYTIVPLALSAQPTFLAQFPLGTLATALIKLSTTVTVGSLQLAGFSSAENDVSPGGVDWISTGLAALSLRAAAGDTTGTADIRLAAQQYLNQFTPAMQSLAVGSLIPGATFNNEVAVRPYAQCQSSPFGCQPARPNVGATALAIATAKSMNPFALTTISVPSSQPTITAVVNAGSFVSGPIAPGEIVTIFGTNFGPATLAGASLDSTGKISTSSGGVQVSIGGTAAPMIYAVTGQVSAVVPYEVAGNSTTTVQITYAGQASNAFSVVGASTAPAVFTAGGTGTGQGAILNSDNNLNSAATPANKGGVVVLYVTGEGQTNPPGVTGKVNNVSRVEDLPVPVQPVTAFVNGQPATVLFAAEAPSFVSGVMQVNVQLPANVSSGNVPITVSVGGNASQPSVTVAVR